MYSLIILLNSLSKGTSVSFSVAAVTIYSEGKSQIDSILDDDQISWIGNSKRELVGVLRIILNFTLSEHHTCSIYVFHTDKWNFERVFGSKKDTVPWTNNNSNWMVLNIFYKIL